jgi:hypothetical protein
LGAWSGAGFHQGTHFGHLGAGGGDFWIVCRLRAKKARASKQDEGRNQAHEASL